MESATDPPEKANWETYPHGADIGLRGFGRTRGEAFANAALAMTAVVTDPAGVAPQRSVTVHCQAPDDETLLIDWLNALVLEMAAQQMLFCRFDVTLNGRVLEARAWGEPVDRDRHQPAVEVKGATYTTVRVGRNADGTWCAQCVVDV